MEDKYGETFEKERLERLGRVKKRHEEWDKKEEKKKQTPKEINEKVGEDFGKKVEELKEHPLGEWSEEQILKELETYPILRCVFFNVVTNSPTMNLMIRISLGYEEEFKVQIGRQLKKLRRMGLVDEILLCKAWWKNSLNKEFKLKMPLSKIEKSVLLKFKLNKDTEERKRNCLIANSGFWFLTDFGRKIFGKATKLIQKEENKSGG